MWRQNILACVTIVLGAAACGCQAQTTAQTPPANETPMTTTPPISLAEPDLSETTGTWLRTETAEAYIAHAPVPRLLVLRKRDADGGPGRNPLLIAGHSYDGLRTLAMDPVQTPNWDKPCNVPAEVVAADETTLSLRGALEPESRMRIEMDFAFAEVDDKTTLTITHRLFNAGDEAREMAAWSCASLTNQPPAKLTVDYAQTLNVVWDNPRTIRRVGFFDGNAPSESSFRFGTESLTVVTGEPMAAGSAKVGVYAPGGRVTYVAPDLTFTSRGPADEAATFPEGGYNVTFYKSWRPDDPQWHYTELEHVAPLETVAPGEASELVQVITFE